MLIPLVILIFLEVILICVQCFETFMSLALYKCFVSLLLSSEQMKNSSSEQGFGGHILLRGYK